MQRTEYELRINDWSSDVCSSDLRVKHQRFGARISGYARSRNGMEGRVKRARGVHRRSAHEKAPDPEDRRLYGMETESLCYGLTGSSLSLSEIRMMPPFTAATARTAMIQLEPPSRPFFFETEIGRAHV